MKKVLWFSLCSLFFFVSAASGQQAPKVESFSPQGTVKNVRQVKVRFTQPMVAFGDPRSVITPFEVECPLKGEGDQGVVQVTSLPRVLLTGETTVALRGSLRFTCFT